MSHESRIEMIEVLTEFLIEKLYRKDDAPSVRLEKKQIIKDINMLNTAIISRLSTQSLGYETQTIKTLGELYKIAFPNMVKCLDEMHELFKEEYGD